MAKWHNINGVCTMLFRQFAIQSIEHACMVSKGQRLEALAIRFLFGLILFDLLNPRVYINLGKAKIFQNNGTSFMNYFM